jgi:hypothetical protein
MTMLKISVPCATCCYFYGFAHTKPGGLPIIGFAQMIIQYMPIIVTITIIGSTALVGPWPPQANVASDFYPGQPSTNFYCAASFRLPPHRQSILISIGHVLFDLQVLCMIYFQVIRFRPFVRHGLPTSTYWILLH